MAQSIADAEAELAELNKGPKQQLVFLITWLDGSTYSQELTVPQAVVQAVIDQMLTQYASVGLLRREGNKIKQIFPSQFRSVEVEVPSIVLASLAETVNVNQKRITLE